MATNYCITYSVYRIVCFPASKMYIGRTEYIPKRRSDHFTALRRQSHFNKHLQNAYNLYGAHSFYFEILEKGILRQNIDEREQYWIAHFDSFHNGYNATPGGETSAYFGIPCTWNGVEYPSIQKAAHANSVSDATMKYRLTRGYKSDADITRPYQLKPCVWNGVKYPSISAAAKSNHVDVDLMQSRIKKGHACDSDVVVSEGRRCSWNNIEYLSVAECAQANGICRQSMRQRWARGYICDADMSGTRKNNRRKCKWNGVEYESIGDAAIACGVNKNTMTHRFKKGYTCDDDIKKRGQ